MLSARHAHHTARKAHNSRRFAGQSLRGHYHSSTLNLCSLERPVNSEPRCCLAQASGQQGQRISPLAARHPQRRVGTCCAGRTSPDDANFSLVTTLANQAYVERARVEGFLGHGGQFYLRAGVEAHLSASAMHRT